MIVSLACVEPYAIVLHPPTQVKERVEGEEDFLFLQYLDLDPAVDRVGRIRRSCRERREYMRVAEEEMLESAVARLFCPTAWNIGRSGRRYASDASREAQLATLSWRGDICHTEAATL